MKRRVALAAFVALVAAGCKPAPEPDEHAPEPAASASPARPAARGDKPVLLGAPANQDVQAYVHSALQRAAREKKKVVVYVGATWCEPCQRFHQALVAGKLDRELSGVIFVEYDLDKSGELLASAGYSSNLIPLFCVPDADGRASQRRIDGSIKGPDAVSEIMPRLARLLDRAGPG